MKKTITTLLILIGINSITFSQATIPNQGLEDWEQIVVKDSVKHWTTSTQDYQNSGSSVDNAYLINDAQLGNKAIHLETVVQSEFNNTDTLLGFVTQDNAENDFVGFPYSDMVTNLKGWYKCNNIGNDTARALVILKLNGNVFSQTMHSFSGIVSTWTQFDIPLTNGNTLTPDSIFIGFVSSNFEIEDELQPGNWLEIDNVWLENNTIATTPILGFSFEDIVQETIEQPIGFWSFDKALYNFGNVQCVTKSNDAAEGTSSMRIESTQLNQDSGLLPLVSNGIFTFQNGLNGGAPFNAQPTIYSFQYKYTPAATDTAFAILSLFKNGITLNTDSILPLTSNTSWTTEVLAININQAPDSARVTFFPGQNVGSTLLIDDIQFLGGDVSVEEISTFNDWTMYPNPSSTELNIKTSENTTLRIVDLSGKTIYTQFMTTNFTNISTEDWNTGVYFVTIEYKNTIETKKLMIQH